MGRRGGYVGGSGILTMDVAGVTSGGGHYPGISIFRTIRRAGPPRSASIISSNAAMRLRPAAFVRVAGRRRGFLVVVARAILRGFIRPTPVITALRAPP